MTTKPMYHLRSKENRRKAACKRPTHSFVEAALQSDCDDCRAVFLVGPVGQPGCHVRKAPDYIPQPDADADTVLRDLRRRRDGR